MPKGLCVTGIAVAALLILLFALDVSLGFPFRGASTSMDVAMIVSGGILGYISWSTLRELK